jgi:hypothetical protein
MAAGLSSSPNVQGNHAWMATSTDHLSPNVYPGLDNALGATYEGPGGDTAGLIAGGLATGSYTAANDPNSVVYTTGTVLTASGTYVGIDDFRHRGPIKAGMSLTDQLARTWPLGN